jgi:hypothetical protein
MFYLCTTPFRTVFECLFSGFVVCLSSVQCAIRANKILVVVTNLGFKNIISTPILSIYFSTNQIISLLFPRRTYSLLGVVFSPIFLASSATGFKPRFGSDLYRQFGAMYCSGVLTRYGNETQFQEYKSTLYSEFHFRQ